MITLAVVLGIGLPVLIFGTLALWSQRNPGVAGVVDGKLRPCPSAPNCVCSHAADAGHAIPPLTFPPADSDRAWTTLGDVVAQFPRTTIVQHTDEYLHATCTTRLVRYVDDLEFLRDPSESVIHVRSASRVGHSDLGANRARVEQIRTAFESALKR